MKHIKKYHSFINKYVNESVGMWIGIGAGLALLLLIKRFLKTGLSVHDSELRTLALQTINSVIANLKASDMDNKEVFNISEYQKLYYITSDIITDIDGEKRMPDIRIMKEKMLPEKIKAKFDERGWSEDTYMPEWLRKKIQNYYGYFIFFGDEEVQITEVEHAQLIEKIKEVMNK